MEVAEVVPFIGIVVALTGLMVCAGVAALIAMERRDAQRFEWQQADRVAAEKASAEYSKRLQDLLAQPSRIISSEPTPGDWPTGPRFKRILGDD